MSGISNNGEEKDGHLGDGKAEAEVGTEEGKSQLMQETANQPLG